MPTKVASFFLQKKQTLKTLPSLLHLILFLSVVIIAVLSLNFEVFRVMRLGDLLILLVALLVSIHWYGQKMLEAGYKDGKSHMDDYPQNDTFFL